MDDTWPSRWKWFNCMLSFAVVRLAIGLWMNMGFLFKTGDLLGCPMDATVTCQIHVPKCSGPNMGLFPHKKLISQGLICCPKRILTETYQYPMVSPPEWSINFMVGFPHLCYSSSEGELNICSLPWARCFQRRPFAPDSPESSTKLLLWEHTDEPLDVGSFPSVSDNSMIDPWCVIPHNLLWYPLDAGNVRRIGQNWGPLWDQPRRVSMLSSRNPKAFNLISTTRGGLLKWGGPHKSFKSWITILVLNPHGDLGIMT